MSNIEIPAMAQPFLPRYEVVSPLGEGGVATVYKVRDTKEGAIKALKALKHGGSRTSSNVGRFEEEYRILRSLHHPSLPEAFDYGITSENTYYIVMDFVEGVGLDDYHEAHTDELWLLLYELSEALAFIHDHGFLHLDLKPKNVLVRPTRAFGGAETPLVTLLDFGVSHRRNTGVKVATVGSPGYMAPEVIRNQGELTRAVDYYSLGVTVYQLVEGRLPFDGPIKEVLQAHVNRAPVFRSPQDRYADLYPRVEGLMSKNPRERLEAFEDFRTLAALKVRGDLTSLEQAYGMGYIDSLSMIGKTDVWNRLRGWGAEISSCVDSIERSRNPYQRLSHGEGPRSSQIDETVDLLTTTVDLASPATSLDEGSFVSTAVRDVTRSFILSGAGGSGKTFVIDALIAELQLASIAVIRLGERGDYGALVAADADTGRDSRVAPHSIIVDRFVRGWERLEAYAARDGVVLVLDGFERANKEEREFFEYASRRLELALDEGRDPRVFLLVTGRSPHLPSDIKSALPRQPSEDAVLAPPGAAQIEQLTTNFHGQMPGIEDRRRLNEYLTHGGRTTGALLDRLKEALLRGDLERSRGAWRFDWTPTQEQRQEDGHEDYYQLLLNGLVGNARELVQWLSCHRGALLLEELGAVSGMTRQALRDAMDRVRAYRVVAWSKDRSGERVSIVSDAVRESFYREIPKRERDRHHQRLVDYFSGMPGANQSLFESLIYHYERLGRSREALAMRIQALASMRRRQDPFSTRRHCAEGIAFARELAGKGDESHAWHIERYFIKVWVETEWLVTNYQNLVDVIRTHIVARDREVPLSFCYKYAAALEKVGELATCKELIAATLERVAEKDSKTYMQLLMAEASVLHATGTYEASIEVLDHVNADEDFIDASGLARICTLYMLNYQNLGNKSKYNQYMRMAESIAQRAQQYDHMLAISASKVLTYFNASQYEKAKRVLRNAIRLALRHRIYREASYLYFLASAVYYEEGRYKQALKYLDKAIRVALNMGMREKVNDYTLRYALIYQNLGYYGNAIRHAETVKNQVSQEYRSEQYFFALLILFDLHNCVNNERATAYKNELDEIAGRVEAKYRLALYHRFSGDYLYDCKEFDAARASFEKAREIYEQVDYDDDAARCVFRIALILTEKGKFEEAWGMLEAERSRIRQMESEELSAEYFMACLTLHDAWQAYPEQTEWFLVACEDVAPRVSNVNIVMSMNALLFRVNDKLGRPQAAIAHFHLYYNRIKEIGNNLPGPGYVAGFMSGREITQALDIFRRIARKDDSALREKAAFVPPA